MTDGVISYPFRLTPQGTAATTDYGSDREVEEAIAVLILTQVGERAMVPEYGVPDPAYAGLHVGDLQTGLDTYGPAGVKVSDVVLTPVNATVSEADILWTRDEATT